MKEFGWDIAEKAEARLLEGQRNTIVAAVRDRFGADATAKAKAFLAGIRGADQILKAYHWARNCQSQAELLKRSNWD